MAAARRVHGQPRLLAALRRYDRRTAAADLAAGVTVGLVALPLAMAFAISSGLTPQAGIYYAIVAGFVISALRRLARADRRADRRVRRHRRRHRRARTASTAFHVHDDGRRHARACSALTGMGSAVRFIPRPVVVGFTNGIAVLIASTQIRDFFGLQVERVPGDFVAAAASAGARMPARGRPRPRRWPRSRACDRDRRQSPSRSACPARSSRWSRGTVAVARAGPRPSRRSARASAAFRRGCRALHIAGVPSRADRRACSCRR